MATLKRQFPAVDLRFHLVMGAHAGPVSDVDPGKRFVSSPDERHDSMTTLPQSICFTRHWI